MSYFFFILLFRRKEGKFLFLAKERIELCGIFFIHLQVWNIYTSVANDHDWSDGDGVGKSY